MAQTNFSALHSIIKPFVPGCPNAVINSNLALAAALFCKNTKVWRETITGEATVTSTQDYLVSVPALSKLEEILFLNLDDFEIERTTDRLEDIDNDESKPTRYAIYQDDYVRFYPTPDAVYSFDITVVLKPSLLATGIEEFLYETHGRAIAYGAIASLLDIPKKEWSDPSLAMIYWDRFDKKIDSAKTRDSIKARLRTTSQFF